MRLKNPLSPLWTTKVLAELPYEIEALQTVPSACVINPLPIMPPRDHPDDEIAIGSNAYFRSVALWARANIHQARDRKMDQDEWQGMVDHAADDIAGLTLDRTLSATVRKRVAATAQAVSTWTWCNVKPIRLRLAPGEVTERQGASARKTAASRSDKTKVAIQAAIRELTNAGQDVGPTAVLAIVQRDQNCSLRTIRRNWSES